MRVWEVPAERDYRQMRTTRPPFITEYEKDLMRWQRSHRNTIVIASTLGGVFIASLLAFTLHWTL